MNIKLIESININSLLNNGIVAKYGYNGNIISNGVSVPDLSLHNHTGTLVNNTYLSPVGFTFSGSDYIDLGSTQFSTGAWSVSYWFYTTVHDESNHPHHLMLYLSNWRYVFGTTNNSSLEDFFIGIPNCGVSIENTDIAVNTWCHIVINYNGNGTSDKSNYSVYINNVSQTLRYTVQYNTLTGNSLIGCRYYEGYTNYFTGKINNVRIYNRVLTNREIGLLYLIEKRNIDGLLVAYSYLGTDISAGNTVIDYSGNENTGTLVNNTYIDSNGFNFSSGDYMTFGTNNINSGAITISLNLYIGEVTNNAIFEIKNDNIGFFYYIDSTHAWFAFRGNPHFYTSNSLILNSWNYITIIYTGGDKNSTDSYICYNNGRLIQTYYSGGTAGPGYTSNLVGREGNLANFSGKISNFIIYNRVLSPSEIMKLYLSKAKYKANFLTGGTASADSEYNSSYLASYAFDENNSTRWLSSNNFNWPHWIKYNLGNSITKIAKKLVLKTYYNVDGARIKNFTVQGSNNDTDYTNISSFIYQNNSNEQVFYIDNINSYQYYKILVTDTYNDDGAATFWKIEMFEQDTY